MGFGRQARRGSDYCSCSNSNSSARLISWQAAGLSISAEAVLIAELSTGLFLLSTGTPSREHVRQTRGNSGQAQISVPVPVPQPAHDTEAGGPLLCSDVRRKFRETHPAGRPASDNFR